MKQVLVTALVLTQFVVYLQSQNSIGLKNTDILNISKEPNLSEIDHVDFRDNRIVAQPNFKFVQLRNTETYILVPEDFQDRIIDFNILLDSNSKLPYVLDLKRMTARISCQPLNSKVPCKQLRKNRNEISCTSCAELKWISASSMDEKFILIPAYRKR